MLEEVGADYRQVLIDYNTQMKTSDYLAINPMGKVPALVHRGRVVTDRAAYYRWLFSAAGPLEAAVMDRVLKVTVYKDQERMVGYGTYEKAIDTLATAVTATDHVAGDRFTAADVYVSSHLMWGMEFGSIPKRPEFEAYVARLVNRRARVAAKAIDDELAGELPDTE